MSKSDGIRGNLRIFLEYAIKGVGYDVEDLSYVGKFCIIGVK